MRVRPLRQYQVYQHLNHLHHRDTRRRREREREQGIENLFQEIIIENFPNLAKETNILAQETHSPKQDKMKQAHTKTHHNYNAKD